MPRQILIVDDIRSNREILKNILGDEYTILEAADGREAMDIMESGYKELSAVLLDLGMPVMDGFEVLGRMQDSKTLSQLPVIVTTGQTDSNSEERALQLGAKDYISKPYKSAIIKQRIWNTIHLRETAATVNALQRDRLTGLYSREAFFEKAAELIAKHEPGHYIMAGFDIDNFKVINDQYGTKKGDEILRYIAGIFGDYFGPRGGVCCRMTADNFAVLYPADLAESELEEIRGRTGAIEGLASPIAFSVGRYRVTDLTLSPSAMYDRASLAENSVKGRYDRNIAEYDESMRRRLLSEQQIVAEMNGALRERQFEVWFQPQYNHSSGALVGAEALVRWRHPERGLIPPNAFIPIFEKNGFVYELDQFVWEETCKNLKRWLDDGRRPLPVSVNVSRYDIFRPNLVEVLTRLIQTYELPVDLLRLEITESAFAESAQQIVEIVKKLIAFGFTVEIDDFGSGYSSLNTLRNVPAQVVKLDMRFLEGDDGTGRGGNILESIVRMTKWLGMSVIAEGVEDRRQADFLKSIGCSYVQGYLYARPMPVLDYETHCRGAEKEERLLSIETVENLDNNTFWDPQSMDTLIFNSFVGAACIFEYYNRDIELLRANDKYAAILGDGTMSMEETLKLDWISCLTPESLALVRDVLKRAGETGEEVPGEYVFLNIPGGPPKTYLRATMRVIASAGERRLVYCICENITTQRQAEQNERRATKQLKSVMDNVNCGITAVTLHGDEARYLLTNDQYFEILGYTREQYFQEIGNRAFVTVHPEDRQSVAEAVESIQATGKPKLIEFRALRRDGETIWLRCSISMTTFEDVSGPVQLSTYTDVTAEKLAAQELLDNLPDGAALYEYDGKNITALHINKRYWELVDRASVNYRDLDVLGSVCPEDRISILKEIDSAIRLNRDIDCGIRIQRGGEGYRPFHAVGRVVPRDDGKYAIYASYTPISDEAMSIREMLSIALRTMMDTQSDFSFVKDRRMRYVCCSRAVYEMAGLTSETDMIGKTDYEILDKAVADEYAEGDRYVMETGESIIDRAGSLPDEDGAERYSNTSKFPLKDSSGNTVGIYGVGRDVTKAHKMESQLELLTNNVPGGIAVYEGKPAEPDRIRLTYFSDGFSRLFGYTRAEYEKHAATNSLSLAFEKDLAPIMDQVRALIEHNTPMDCVYRAKINGGGYKWINIKAEKGKPHGEFTTVNAVLFDVTGRQEALERLRMSEEENRLALAHSGCVISRYTVEDRTISVLPEVAQAYSIAERVEDVPYGPVRDGMIAPESRETYIAMYEAIENGSKSGSAIYKERFSSAWRWIRASYSTIFSSDGKPASAVISYYDVSDELEKDAVYKKWRQSLRNKEPQSYSLFRCNVSKRTNFDAEEGALISADFAPGEFDFDRRVEAYAEGWVLDADAERFRLFLNVNAMLAGYYQGRRSAFIEFRERMAGEGGGFRWLKLTVDLVESPHSREIEAYLLFENIDGAKRQELLTKERAELDPLTGVLNRAVFEEKVNERIRNGKPLAEYALLMLDIDGFKLVNDAFGHSAGDQALMDVASALRATTRRDDLVGRLGGDEFAVFLNDIPGDSVAAGKAKEICALARKSFSMEVEISGSVGIAIAPRDGSDFSDLYKKADSALYHVKGSGKDSYAFYHADMVDEHLKLEKAENPTALRGKKRRMLIVDDSRIDHAFLTNIFADDFMVEKAKDGATALIRLRHYGSAISVVLLDLVMPGMDGFAVLERMQQSAEMRTIPVIVVSGVEDREASLRAIRAGATDYVTKPVDPEVLRIRVKSAVSKVDNERLRAKNSFLEFQNSEVMRYRTVLERSGTVVVEHDWITGAFLYAPNITEYIAGTYDGRKLWHILLTDLVADTATVKRMQELVHAVAMDRRRRDETILVQLKTPAKIRHWFRMGVYKVMNEFGLTGKIYITFNDLGTELPG